MDENNELLEYIYQDANMGISTLTTLINTINTKENKIKKDIENQIKDYECIKKEAEKLLKKNKVEQKEISGMAKMGAWLGIKTEMLKDNSDANVADLVIRGLTMGQLDIIKKIDNYKKDVDKKILDLAQKLNKFQKDNIAILKKYL